MFWHCYYNRDDKKLYVSVDNLHVSPGDWRVFHVTANSRSMARKKAGKILEKEERALGDTAVYMYRDRKLKTLQQLAASANDVQRDVLLGIAADYQRVTLRD